MRTLLLTLSDPWATTDGGTLRTRAFAQALSALGNEVIIVFPSSAPPSRHPDELDCRAVATRPVGQRLSGPLRRLKRAFVPVPTGIGARSRAIEEEVARLGPVDLLVVNQLPLVRYQRSCTPARLWLDFSDLFSAFAASELAVRRGPARATSRVQHAALVAAERRAARHADVVSAAGWTDARLIHLRSDRPVSWLPTPVPAPEQVPARPASHPRVAGFFANFSYWPNVDALRLLADVWAPRLEALGWCVMVAGTSSEAMRVPPSIQVVGQVETPAAFYEAVDVVLVPLRTGGGMKVKVIEALLHERPVMTTAFAVEGFPPEIRDAVTTVDPVDPDLSVLADVARTVPRLAPAARRRFSSDGFLEGAAAILAELRR